MRFLPWTLCWIVTAHASAALADELPFRLPETREKTPEVMTLRSLHLRDLAVREEAVEPAPSRERWTDRLEPSSGGLKYHDSFALGGHRYRFSVRGPVQKDKRLGLTLGLRF